MAVKIFRWKAIGPLLLLLPPHRRAAVALRRAGGQGHHRGGGHRAARHPGGRRPARHHRRTKPRWTWASCRSRIRSTSNRNLVEAAGIRLKLNPRARREEVRGGELPAERHALRHRPEDPGAAGRGRWIRAPGAPLGPPVGAAVRRAPPPAHPDRHDQAAGAEPDPAHVGAAAQTIAARTDSSRRALEQSFQQLDIAGTVDTARRLAERLRATNPKALGLDGTRQAIEDTRATLKRLEGAKARLDALERAGEGRRPAASSRGSRPWTRPGGRTTPSPGPCSSCRPSPRPRSARPSSAGSASIASSRRCTTPSWRDITCRPACSRGRTRVPSGCGRRGETHPVSQGAGMAQVPPPAGPGGPRDRRRQPAAGRVRGGGPGRSPRTRRSTASPTVIRDQPDRRGERHRRHRRERGDRSRPARPHP